MELKVKERWRGERTVLAALYWNLTLYLCFNATLVSTSRPLRLFIACIILLLETVKHPVNILDWFGFNQKQQAALLGDGRSFILYCEKTSAALIRRPVLCLSLTLWLDWCQRNRLLPLDFPLTPLMLKFHQNYNCYFTINPPTGQECWNSQVWCPETPNKYNPFGAAAGLLKNSSRGDTRPADGRWVIWHGGLFVCWGKRVLSVSPWIYN